MLPRRHLRGLAWLHERRLLHRVGVGQAQVLAHHAVAVCRIREAGGLAESPGLGLLNLALGEYRNEI